MSVLDELFVLAREGFSRGWDPLDAQQRLERIAEIEQLLGRTPQPTKPACKGTWHGGVLQTHHAPDDGAKCTYDDRHDGFCSFIRAAHGYGWTIPDQVIETRARVALRAEGYRLNRYDGRLHVEPDNDNTERWRFTFKPDITTVVTGYVRLEDGIVEDVRVH